eukprot:CAMPEP_0197642326 /NCGR_PEP_ID=MMETSP1338-20131121/16022_1 /TAXON_ID=43686 ORGANISM="Pelagodinium beii, Strain RCC1491" /NCGR_SAMPLE_ID=MMETSP1338 /ASSEMBLY_ACC=CAM_ASM_000754 /LENGTH=96 /DNA_ID=CAMNT_0043215433 /DNA_START=85 /DNA_END=371 /DNA_ORIENTATION=+
MATQRQSSVTEVLDKIVEQSQSSGVCGAICLHSNGFTIESRGDLLPEQRSHIVGVAEGCSQLEPGAAAPVITLETTSRTLSISTREDLVVAVARKP